MSKNKAASNRGNMSAESAQVTIAKFDIVFKFFRHVVTAVCWIIGIWLVMEGLPPILIHGKADQFQAISGIVSALKPSSLIGYAISWILFGMYRIERSGKKRAIKEKARLQKLLEQNEPNRTSSKLTCTGDTPNGRSEDE